MANMLRYIGPAFVVGVAFMEPGNWVSLLEGGSRFGYELAWAVVISILLAMLFQTISARLGVVTGKDFAQVCREEFPSAVCVLLWGLCEISIITSDLTMVLGTAVALNVVFRMPALPSIVLMAVDSLLFMLLLPLLEMKRAVVMTVVVSGVIVLCFFVDNVVNGTAPLSMAVGLLPRIKHETLYATISIIGAHVLPQNFYLNSSLVKDLSKTSTSLSSLLNHYLAGTVSAFSAVLVVNLAILGVAVAAFHNAGLVVVTLLDAQALIEQILNSTLCPSVFGLTLLYAGQLSTLNSGTAGQVVSEGFFDYKIYPWQHRILIRGIALVPLATWSWRYGSEGIYQLLVFSQVLLALNLPFTVVPLIKVTSSERIMGSFKNSFFLETSAWLFLGVMSAANVTLVFDLVFGDDGFGGFEFDVGLEWFFEMTGENGQTLVVGAISVVTTLALGFLVWLIFTPLQLDSQVPARYLWIEDYAKQDEIVGWGSANLVAKPIASETVVDPVPVPVPIPVAVPVPVPISIKVPVHVPVPAILDTDAADLKDDEPDILVGELPALGVSPEVDIKLSELESSADAGESLVSVQTQNHLELESHNDRKDSNAPAEGTHSTPPRVSRISPETSIDSTPPVAPSLPSTVSNNDTVDVGTSTAVEDIEVTALKNAEAEADAETAEIAEKDDDEGNLWTGPKDVQAEGPSSVSNVNDSVRSLHCDGPESLGKGDPNTASSVEPVEGGSGSGSLSRLSGLGRAARRQFALILDEFWTNLFDLHGQPVTSRWKGSQGGSRGNQQDGNLRGGVSSPKDAVDSQYSNLSKQQKAHLLHMRNHAAASMVASQSSFQQPQDYMATSPTYRNERRYSSLHIPPRQEELDYQPATIHGYKLSQMSGRSGLGLRPYQADASHYRSPRDYQTLGLQSDAEMDAADLCRGSAYDYGNQPLLSSQWVLNVVGNRRPTDLKGRSDGFVGKADEQYLDQFDGVNRVSSSPSTQWDPLVFRSRDSPLGRWNPLVYRATGELDMKDGSLGVPRDFPHQQSSLGHSPIGRGSHGGDAERAPLVFDELSPSQSHRDAFSIQTSLPRAETQSLWARQPFEQLFGATDSEGGVAAQTSGQFKRVSSQMPKSSASGPVSASDAAEFELDVLEKLQTCVQKLFCLEGADWLFRSDNGADEELVTAIAVTLRAAAEGDKKEQHNFSGAYGNHEHHHSQLENNYSRSNLRRGGSHSNSVVSRRSPYNSVRNCGEGCVWDGSLLISFGVWCVHRILELSLMESRPELWGKYTYVLNRLQGILEPAFSKQRVVPGFCRCINESALDARKRRASILKQGSYGSGDFGSSLSVPSLPNPWPWGRNTTCVKGKSLSATVFVDMIKEVEIAVGSRKGRTGTAAGDVAFPKGKENLASVLKRYKRRLLNKPPGSTSVGGGGRRV